MAKAKRILGHSLKTFLNSGDPKANKQHTSATTAFLDHFARLVDEDFFSHLQDLLEAPEEHPGPNARALWLADDPSGLVGKARSTLKQATDTLAAPATRRRLAQDEAHDAFDNAVRRRSGFPEAFTTNQTTDNLQRPDPPPARPILPPDCPHTLAPALAGYISQLAAHRRSHFAQLRRMDPTRPDSPAFQAIVKRYDIDLTVSPDSPTRWGHILRAMAGMTPSPRPNTGTAPTTAHNPLLSLGQALHDGQDPNPTNPFYSPTKLQALLHSRDTLLNTNLESALALLARDGISIDWRHPIALILAEGRDHHTADSVRDLIDRDYHQARRKAASTAARTR